MQFVIAPRVEYLVTNELKIVHSPFARQAWQKLGAMPPEEAMQKYIDIVTELYPSWATGSAIVRV